jgi:arabinofuranosyltransferase
MNAQKLKEYAWLLLLLLPALAVYLYISTRLDFIQDDAYISYRYVQNFLNGHGLVYNIGERVEGFTNFGWVVYLAMWGSWGINFILVSKITGYILGGLLVVLCYLLGVEVLGEKGRWYAVLAAYLVGINQSVAYWSPAGLETAAFSLAVGLSIYWWIRRSWLLIAGMLLSVWLRPEGALVCGVLLVAEGIVERRIPKFALYSLLSALVLSLPLVGFKLTYYGGILPNPFYAKTTLHWEQLANGFEYTWQFLRDYGVFGLGLVVPLAFYRRLESKELKLWWLAVGYILYITLIGGDVLKVHRFYIPLVGANALLLALSVRIVAGGLKPKTQLLVGFVAGAVMIALSYQLPHEVVKTFNNNEKRFTNKMDYTARQMRDTDRSAFSVATPTIGIFGWDLLDHAIIDMVGLTDTTIARYSEPPIPGMMTTWKEQKHNSKYLLTRAPDYIVFSTGAKPSAPAERALLLYPQFMDCYRTVGWLMPTITSAGGPAGAISPAFKRMKPLSGELAPSYPVKYVQYYKTALDFYSQAKYAQAIVYLDSAQAASPKPPYIYIAYYRAFCWFMLQRFDLAEPQFDSIVAIDSTLYEPHKELYLLASVYGQVRKAETHRRWLLKLVPWFEPQIESLVRQAVAAQKQSAGHPK